MSTPIPDALISRNPLDWLRIFGPGAIIASLTIGTGELIFSTRGGVIFGYAVLQPFLLICLLKWALAYSAARHMVIAGVHPFQRWMSLSFGPRGWLTILFFLLAVAFIPVWVSFHASVLGDLFAMLTDTKGHLGGATIHLWGAGILTGSVALALTGGYAALEKTQIVIVASMLATVLATLALLGPDWAEIFSGFAVPRKFEYPDWLTSSAHATAQKIVNRPVWVELSLYMGVIGGAGYDYLAYASYIRDKRWGNASPAVQADASELASAISGPSLRASIDERELRQWIRAPLIDCTLSFLIVLVFSAVFVVAGKLVLGPAQQIPGDGAFLEHQAQFVTRIHPWLYPLYVAGVFLAMTGTLYGTLEIAPTVLRETVIAVVPNWGMSIGLRRLRILAIGWCALVAMGVLAASFMYQLKMGAEKPPGLTAILIPVNLFTGVFACGLICLLNPWMDRRLPTALRMPIGLALLNFLGGVGFVLVALRGYWDFARWWSLGIICAIFALGICAAWVFNVFRRSS